MFDETAKGRVVSISADVRILLSRLSRLEPAGAGADALLEAAAALEDAVTALQAAQARVLVALEVFEPVVVADGGPAAADTLDRVSAHEVSAVLGCPLTTARQRIDVAEEVCRSLPGVLGLAGVGGVRWWQVRRAASEIAMAGLYEAGAALVDERLVADVAAGRAGSGFLRRLRRHVLAADPEVAEQLHEDAVAGRKVVVRPSVHGMSWVGAELPAEDARTVGRCLDHLADTLISRPYPAGGRCRQAQLCSSNGRPANTSGQRGPGEQDDRCADQRRADALSGLARLVLDALDLVGTRQSNPARELTDAVADASIGDPSGPAGRAGPRGGDQPSRTCSDVPTGARSQTGSDGPGRSRRIRPRGEVAVTVSAETLLGVSTAPAELTGYGPLTPAHARRIATSAGVVWRRLLTDPVTGTLLDRGRTTYRPPPDLAALIRARFEGRCTRPFCTHRASDLDHAVPWFDRDGGPGGRTSADNLHPTCRGCHTVKHRGWTVSIGPDGAASWMTPHSWCRTTHTPDLRPEDRSAGSSGAPRRPAASFLTDQATQAMDADGQAGNPSEQLSETVERDLPAPF